MLPRLPAATLSSPGLLLSERDQFGQRVHAERGRDGDPKRLFADKADRHEVAHQVDRKVLLKLGQCNEIRGERHIERMAVRCCRRDGLDGNGAGAAGLIEHDHLLTPQPGQMLGDHPADDIGRRTRANGGHDFHRTVGKGLCARLAHCEQEACPAGEQRPAREFAATTVLLHDDLPGFRSPTVAMAFPVGDEINLAKFYGLVSALPRRSQSRIDPTSAAPTDTEDCLTLPSAARRDAARRTRACGSQARSAAALL